MCIVQDTTCIGGLVLVLSNPDEKIVKLALEVNYFLCFITSVFSLGKICGDIQSNLPSLLYSENVIFTQFIDILSFIMWHARKKTPKKQQHTNVLFKNIEFINKRNMYFTN